MKSDKQNKTFALSQRVIGVLEGIQGKSAFVEELIVGSTQGRFIRKETADIMTEYKSLFGADPEKVVQLYFSKRISKIKGNMVSLKDSPREEVKNKVGGAFLKLNQAFHDLVTENESLKDKLGITFGLLFKKTGCNHSSVRNWLRAHKASLDEYHASVGIVDPASHNRLLGVLKRIAKFEEKTKMKAKEVKKEVARIKRERVRKELSTTPDQKGTGATGKKKKTVAKGRKK